MPRPKLTNWMHPGAYSAAAATHGERRWEKDECAFDRFVRERAIPEAMWKQSVELRAWCRAHANTRYIPETLLNAFAIDVTRSLDWRKINQEQNSEATA